ncbi:YeiH family protein [Chitinophaga sp. Cy-1792]|uniref:YeiH family protein n=1 Tax=Chitinophaga sp. Cy-1792 TaxID=2608339 RepID=UPI001422FAF6|nr:putative sulfate exporter family transporter [Chitinophaga sp. Cy-1792]NIG55958.1 putative sulfate exporter family transporter [Chitinophaga sp. Cy-1792]
MSQQELAIPQPKPLLEKLTEDWWAVITGGFIVALILAFALSLPDFKIQVPVYSWSSGEELIAKVLSPANLLLILLIGGGFFLLSAIAVKSMGDDMRLYLPGFGVIYLLAVTSLIISGNKTLSYYGLEYVIFALVLGLILGNSNATPTWIKKAARSEFFIKTGLVILGSSILFTDIIKAGLPGIIQAILVVAAVWFFALWLSRKLKVDDEFGVILASAVSICGVAAAIVASGAIQGDKKKLSYVTTLVLIVAIPMLVLQPWLIKVFHIPEIVGGAWLGGTLDTTASVAAAAQIVGPGAVKAGVIIKFSQNVLIGVAAFFIAIWWSYRPSKEGAEVAGTAGTPGFGIVWERFPKFVLGFLATSLLFSFVVPASTIGEVKDILKALQTIWFAMAFVSIGLEARFKDLVQVEGGRPALAFIGAQIFNVIWTLIWAWILFGGYLFAVPDIK